MTTIRSLARGFVALALGACLLQVSALAQGPTGRIDGVVRDEQGGALPGVTMTLRNQETGVTRNIVTEADGKYSFPALSPGRYTVRAELSGFATQEAKDITITIGFEQRLDLEMKVRSLQETVTVVGESPVVDTTKAEVAGVVTQQQIEMLPINSRQYLSLALLVPGTTIDATRNFFATVNVGGSMTFNGTGNVVDGMINNWVEDGEPRQDLPQEAVEQFKVTNSSYKAEFGLATGGIVQTVTKSGTNALRGSLYEYYRDKALNAKGVFEKEKPEYQRNQFGGSAGGPIVKDKVHYFASLERTNVDEFYTVNTGQPQFYSAVEGTFPLSSNRTLYSGRVDWQMNNNHALFGRFLGETDFTPCNGCGGTTASSNDQDIPRESLVLGHTWIRGAKALNDFRFQWAHAAFYGYPGGTEIWKTVGEFPLERTSRGSRQYRFPSLGYGSNYDDLSPETRWEFRDTYSLNKGKHDLKFGGEFNYNPYTVDNALNLVDTGGTYQFTRDQLFDPNNPATISALTGASSYSALLAGASVSHPTKYYVGFVQDDWALRPNVTVNLGLRYERLYGNANEDLDPNSFPRPLPFVDVSVRGDKNNFGPRLGAVWDLKGDGNTVIRGAWGMYYGHIRLLGTLGEFNNYKLVTVTIPNPSYPDPFNGRDPHEFISSAPANITVVDNHMIQPLAYQTSAGLSQRLTSTLAVHVDAIVNNTNGDYKTQDLNPRNPATGIRPDLTYGRIDQVQPAAELEYRAVYTKLERRFANNYQYLFSYTYTHSRDNAPMARFIDQFNPNLYDFGPSNGERRHAIVASGSVLLKYDIILGGLWTYRSQLPWSATAGRDLNNDTFVTDLVPGTTRNSGSRNLNLDAVNIWRAANGLAAVTNIDTSRINLFDLRVSKRINLGNARRIEVLVQAFNLFNTKNLQAQFGGGRQGNALSATFGAITTARPNRQIELGARLNW
jgi:outer membrane receptor protein involved in Fe transport